MNPHTHLCEFHQTRWSVIMQAAKRGEEGAGEAMETLCRMYWYPLYAFVRRSGQDPATAQDITQDFFVRLIERDIVAEFDPARGRFRSWLLGALKHFLANRREHDAALKRGGGREFLSLESMAPEDRYAAEPAVPATPESAYEKRWAQELLEHALVRLAGECDAEGRTGRFGILKPFLLPEYAAADFGAAASQLGTTEGAVRSAVHRLRERFRRIFRDEVARTVASEPEVEEEIRYLAGVLAG